MITVTNYNKEKANIDWSKLPSSVKDLEPQVEGWFKFYDKSDTIKETVDLYLKQVNTAFAKAKKEPKAKKTSKPQEKPQNLSQFKKYLKSNIGELLYLKGTYTNGEIFDTRKIDTVQTDSVKFIGSEGNEPWTYFGKARHWTFTEKYAALDLNGGGLLTYYYNKPNDWKTGPTRLPLRSPGKSSTTSTPLPKKESSKKAISKKVDANTVDHFDKEYMLLRRFYNKVKSGKILSNRELRLLYMAFQKSVVGRDVKKTTPNSLLFKEVNKKVVKLFNITKKESRDVVPSFSDNTFVPRLKTYVDSTKINYAVTLLRSFIGMQGTDPGKEKAQRLLKRFENGVKKGRVSNSNRLYEQVKFAIKELEDYIKTNDPIDTKEFGLSKASSKVCENRVKCEGLDDEGKLLKGYYFAKGGAVVKVKPKQRVSRKAVPKKKPAQKKKVIRKSPKKKTGLGNPIIVAPNALPPSPTQKKEGRYSAADIMNMEFEKMMLPPEWARLFPDAPEKLHLAFMGKPKNGKSMSACQWGAVVGKGKKVLYNFADQGVSASTKKILSISGLAKSSTLVVTSSRTLDALEQDIKDERPDYVFVDMINNYIDNDGATPQDFENRFIHGYPDISFSLIFEATKTGDFKGDQKWTHIVDQLITVEDYVMFSKGRYGSGKRLVWPEEVQRCNPSKYQEVQDALDLFKEENGIATSVSENTSLQTDNKGSLTLT